MDFKELIDRINFLYHKSVNEGLTEEEFEEQKRLRRIYIDGIKSNIVAQLGVTENTSKAAKN